MNYALNQFEKIYTRSLLSVVAVAGGVLAVTLATHSAHNQKATPTSLCTGVEFLDGQGGPGLVDMSVYPILGRNAVANVVFGTVIDGNDKSEPISNFPVLTGSGEFDFSWNTAAKTMQTSEVLVSAIVPGYKQAQVCPLTTLNFNPANYQVSPVYNAQS